MPPKQNGKKEELRVSFLPSAGIVQKGEESYGHKIRTLSIVMGVLIVVIGMGSVYFSMAARGHAVFSVRRQQESSAQKDELRAIQQELKDVGALGQMTTFAQGLLATHTASERMLYVLESSVVDEVVVSALAVDAKGTMILSARGNNIGAVVRQIIAWNAHGDIADVRVSGIAVALDTLGNVEGVDFNASLTLVQGTLIWKP